MKLMKSITLDTWQKEILDYEGNILLCTGRQVGKTTIMALKACKYMLKHKGSRIIICSLTEDQAILIVMIMIDFFEKNYPKLIDRTLHKKPTNTRVCLKNGSQVLARPVGNTGSAVRGFTSDVLILDEVSRFNELILTAAKPILMTTGGKIWMCSTPFGKQGFFYESFLNKNKRFKVWHISSEEVINNREISESWSEKKKHEAIEFLKHEKADMSELQYGQEYLGLFLDDLSRFFSDELIEKCCTKQRPGAIMKGKHYLGVDIGRLGGDETTFEILNVDENRSIRHVENIVKTKRLTTETEADIYGLEQAYNFKAIGIDAGAGSLGVGIFDRMIQNSLTRVKTHAMNNRQISIDSDGKKMQRIFKEDMYDNLRNMMEKGEIMLLDDDNVKLSLSSIIIEIPKEETGISKIKIWGNYSHIVEGLIRAAWLAKKEKTLNLWVRYN